MNTSNFAPLLGRFKAENRQDVHSAYSIIMDVRETEKSYIFQLVELDSRYSADHISHLFSKSRRVVIRKAGGGHAIRKWEDGSFTFYPFQAGVPFSFEKMEADAGGAAGPVRNCRARNITPNVNLVTAPIIGTASAGSGWSMTVCPALPSRTGVWTSCFGQSAVVKAAAPLFKRIYNTEEKSRHG